MKFDLSSFLLGYGAGAGSVLLGKRLRPLLLEIATVAYRFGDSVVAKAVMKHEDLEDLLAEAKARARGRSPASSSEAQA